MVLGGICCRRLLCERVGVGLRSRGLGGGRGRDLCEGQEAAVWLGCGEGSDLFGGRRGVLVLVESGSGLVLGAC